MATILILGATGYIGGRLVPRLLDRGHRVRCLVRDSRKAAGRPWGSGVELVEGDVLRPASLHAAFESVDVVFYLIHSMAARDADFEDLDRRAARNVATVAAAERVGRIIYLGGLGRRDKGQSPHLRSRHEVGRVLRQGSTTVTEFRAAVVVGSGGISFELIHHLVNRLPVMICPRWVYTRTQPIAIRDVLAYLVQCIDKPETAGKVIDIGGPEVLTYGDMMLTVAKELGLRRLLIQVPVLTPRLSSYWVNLVTPIQTPVARVLIESLRHETICENDLAEQYFDIEPIDFRTAVRLALTKVRSHDIETTWTSAGLPGDAPGIDPSHLHQDVRTAEVDAPADCLFDVVQSIGGDTGWYYGSWLWRIRGFIDQQVGGVGLRRGRRHPTHIAVGDALDFWRVEEYIPGEKLTLRAEMRVWGQAWLEFDVESLGENRSRLTQTARYYPRGLFGLAYWYGIYPIHTFVFRGMARGIGRAAERCARSQTKSGA
jgi:uncharacterized protein YbjT (DUF2867 family)